MIPIQAVIFDRDNTLVYFDEAQMDALEERMLALAPALPRGAAATLWESWHGVWPRAEDDEPEFWLEFWNSLAERHMLGAEAAAALQEIGGFYHTCFVLFPDALACLASLRAAGLQLAILTNFELPSVARTLTYAGVDPSWFAALLSSSALGVRKPEAEAFLAAAAALGLPPEVCAFVDDLPENVAAARLVGMRGILLDRSGGSDGQPDTLSNLDGLAALLAV